MRRIDKATPDQAERLFDILVRAVDVACAPYYPPEVIAIWNKGRSAEGQARVIAEGHIYSIQDAGAIRGFVDIADAEIVGLYVHPDDHGKGYGTDLFRFAVGKIRTRPITIKSTLNAAPFYAKLGCRKVATESVRRHDHDIYVERMELV
jgi:GNAT superfamily N-acetyltransferase